MDEQKKHVQTDDIDKAPRLSWGAYVALLIAVLFFSGVLANIADYKWLSAMDFSTLSGKFGTMAHPEKNNFMGEGGRSARAGFLFALSLVPAVMLSLGVLEVLTHYGAIRAAQKFLTPLLKPLLGLPGRTGLAMITDLQSTDAGAALTKELYNNKQVTRKELVIMTGWQYTGAGMISNYVTTGAALFGALTVPIFVPLVLMFVLKFVAGAIVRIVMNTVYKGDFIDEQ